MNSRYKDKLVGVYAPGSYDHVSVLGQTQEFSRWFWENRKDMDLISAKLGINAKKLNRILTLEQAWGIVLICRTQTPKHVEGELVRESLTH